MKHLAMRWLLLFLLAFVLHNCARCQPGGTSPQWTEIVLPNRTLLQFNGSVKGTLVELKGTLSASHTYDMIIVEKSYGSSLFERAGEIQINGTNASEFSFTFSDNNITGNVLFYRVKLLNTPQRIYEYSNTLMIKMNNSDLNGFRIFNTLVRKEDPSITLQSSTDEEINFSIVDLSGRNQLTHSAKISKGINVVDFSGLHACRGYFILYARTKYSLTSHKIYIQ